MSRRNKITVQKPSPEARAELSAQKKSEKQAKKEQKAAKALEKQVQSEQKRALKLEQKQEKKLKKAEAKTAKKEKKTLPASQETEQVKETEPLADLPSEPMLPDPGGDREKEKAGRSKLKTKRRKKAEKKPKPVRTLSPQEQRKRNLRLRRRVYFAAWTVATLLLYLGLIGIVVIGIYFNIWMTDSGIDNTTQTSLRVVAELNDGKTRRQIKARQENGSFYLPITLVDSYDEYIHAGDFKARTIQFIGSGESAVFSINSPFCLINGVSLNMQKPVLLLDGELYLPLEFYQNYLTGLNFKKSGSGYEILSNNKELGYTLKPAASSINVPEEEAGSLLEFSTKVPEFLSDLSAYERYMNPGETTEFLTLVNASHGISETYRPDDLTGVEDQNAAYPGGDYHAKLRLSAAKSLDAMLQEARANGFDGLQATSGYRTYAEQNYRFNSMVSSLRAKGLGQAEAELQAMRTVHRPGYSEYQTGLAVDVRFPGESIDDFKDTAAAAWLAENAYKFGFILRYPADKEGITGMDYEAWHFRYVGRYHAIRIKYLDLSLEEYVDFMALESN